MVKARLASSPTGSLRLGDAPTTTPDPGRRLLLRVDDADHGVLDRDETLHRIDAAL